MARAHTCTPPLHTTVLALPAYLRCLPPSSPLSAAYYFFSFHDSFLLREFSPSRIDILLTSGQLVEFQSSGHRNRIGRWTGRWAGPMDGPMDAAPFGQGPRVKGEPMSMAPSRAVTTRHRHPASLSSSAGERGGRAAPVSRGRMGTSTRTPTDTLRLAGCPHTQAPTLVQTNVATQTRPRRRPWRWVARCRRRRAWR